MQASPHQVQLARWGVLMLDHLNLGDRLSMLARSHRLQQSSILDAQKPTVLFAYFLGIALAREKSVCTASQRIYSVAIALKCL